MKVGVQFKPEDFPVFLESVRKAEDSGFSRVYLVDGQLLWRDIYVYMTHALAATKRIPVASAVTNPFTRHFSVTANVHATLAEIYPGRVMLGIGRGDNAVRTLGLNPVATNQLKDVVPGLRALMSGRPTEFNGSEIRSVWGPHQNVPILMPGSGPRNLRLAGALADVVMIQVGANPASCKWAVDHIRAGAESANRDPSDVKIVAHCAMCISDDMAEARRETRWIAELVAIHVASVARSSTDHGMPEPLTRLAGLRRSDYDYSSHLDDKAERPEYPDEVIDDVALIGSPEVILEKLGALAEVGIDEVAPAYLNGQLEQMELIGREIIPRALALTGSSASS